MLTPYRFLVVADLGESVLGADARLAHKAVSEGALAVVHMSCEWARGENNDQVINCGQSVIVPMMDMFRIRSLRLMRARSWSTVKVGIGWGGW